MTSNPTDQTFRLPRRERRGPDRRLLPPCTTCQSDAHLGCVLRLHYSIYVRCATCGCVMNWERVRPRKVNYVGVNARNFDPSVLGAVRIRLLDGANTWKYLD